MDRECVIGGEFSEDVVVVVVGGGGVRGVGVVEGEFVKCRGITISSDKTPVSSSSSSESGIVGGVVVKGCSDADLAVTVLDSERDTMCFIGCGVGEDFVIVIIGDSIVVDLCNLSGLIVDLVDDDVASSVKDVSVVLGVSRLVAEEVVSNAGSSVPLLSILRTPSVVIEKGTEVSSSSKAGS